MTDELKQALDTAVKAVAAEKNYQIPEGFIVRLERPRQEGHGDWATNIAMQLSKPFGVKPRDLAEDIIAKLPKDSVIERAEVAGPGFMNFTLSSNWVTETVKNAIEKGDGYGRSNVGGGRRIQVEFVSANPTGPLHMGHGRGAAVGDITASLLDFAGYNVEREYYINDAGLQMELLGKSAQARYFEALGRAEEAPMPEDGYHGDYMSDIAKSYVEKYGDSLAQKPLEETLPFFSEETGRLVLELIKKDLEDFGVKFDVWFSEKSLYDDNLVEPAMQALKERDYAYEDEGALWFRSTMFGDDKDRVLIRSNGMPTYFTSDVAYLKNKYDRGFEKNIYVWGADHHGYVPRLKSVNKAFGFPDDGIDVLLIQMVNLLRDGKPVQMSKRAGTIVTLREIMDEVGRDAAHFFFVIRRCDSTVDFDLELAKKASSENPVFYIQYAHARICSIRRELAERGIPMPTMEDFDVSLLTDPTEINLAKAVSRFPEEIMKAAEETAPHRLVYYATELAEAFHAFYNAQRVLGVEENVMKSRILLMEAARVTLKNALGILGVSAPEKM
ncbi:arginine--tRNA ligase [Cloacibacillus sp.]|uniref:arginine--tRNA ligase n=1 Tax=Cloacibacillus sp. TaxID=2049023 RepID=UPI0025C3AE9D|nr:arginine--tRNA ligase [Cloacibacillus sp.]MCC8057710.1 arginine--tRNA ligase [Cloacibacillus sp.]